MPLRKSLKIPGHFETRLLLFLGVGLSVSVLGPTMLYVPSQPDLSYRTPLLPTVGDSVLLGWAALERNQHAMRQGAAAYSGERVRMLGYMTDGGRQIRSGDFVHDFLLLPESGNWLHPAQLFGDQMVDVHLPAGHPALFSPGSLVWVEGLLGVLPGDPLGSRPLYELSRTTVRFAGKSEIRMYFR